MNRISYSLFYLIGLLLRLVIFKEMYCCVQKILLMHDNFLKATCALNSVIIYVTLTISPMKFLREFCR